jgi:hypothetical protein
MMSDYLAGERLNTAETLMKELNQVKPELDQVSTITDERLDELEKRAVTFEYFECCEAIKLIEEIRRLRG